MPPRCNFVALSLLATTATAAASHRGANTWYSFFGSSNETQALAAASYMAEKLLPFGYDTYTLDEGWAEDAGRLLLDDYGRPTWNPAMFPSGIPGVAANLKALGVKLGLWLVRGVPREAAQRRLPIFGTPYTADAAVRLDRNCSWSNDCYGSNSPSVPAAAYYASVAQQIASWGVSLVKLDCMWPHLYEGTPQPYFNEDVDAMTMAFKAAGLTLSLSPGISVSPQNGSYIADGARADFYRIAEDVLDVYDGPADGTFPQGVHQKLKKALEFEALLGANGTSPDFDMLMVGRTIHAYGPDQVPPTETRLTRPEQVTAMTLFAFAGVPLIVGGLVPLDDDANGTWTLSLLTNAEVLAVHNASAEGSRASFAPPEAGGGGAEVYGWRTTPAAAPAPALTRYASFYSAEPAAPAPPQRVSARFELDLGLPAGTSAVCLRDLWSHAFVEPVGGPLPAAGGAAGFTVGVEGHGARAFLVAPVGSAECAAGLA